MITCKNSPINYNIEFSTPESNRKIRYLEDFKVQNVDDNPPSLYPSPYVHIVRWSKIWGLLPVSYRSDKQKWVLSSWLVFWGFCSIGFNIPTFYNCIMSSVSSSTGITLYVMILIIGIMSFTAISTHALTMFHHKKWSDFLNNWMKFEKKFPTISVGVHSTKLMLPLCFYCCSYVVFFIVNVLNELRFNIMNGDGVGRMLALIYVYVIYSFTLSTPLLWIVMNSKITSLCLEHIRSQLSLLTECMGFAFVNTEVPIRKCLDKKEICRLQDAVLEIAKLIESFKDIMGPLMLVIIPHHIISLICFLYWTIVSMLDYTDWYLLVSFGLLSLQAVAPIFVCAIYSEDVENKVNFM